MSGDNNKIFVKVYVTLWTSGLGAKLGADRGYTLMALASFMDDGYVCWPTIKTLAAYLGVSEQTASKRVRDLLAFRWNGEPIITKVKRQNGAWGNNVYRLSDWCQVAIFKAEPTHIEPDTTPDDSRRADTGNIEKARAAKEQKRLEDVPQHKDS